MHHGLMVVALTIAALLLGVLLGWLLAARRSDQQLTDARVEAARLRALLESQQGRDTEQFANVAAEVLDASSDRLLTLAAERFNADHHQATGELAAREQSFRNLLEPLNRTLDEVKRQLSTTEQARVEGHALLDAQVRGMREEAGRLRAETSQLVTALRASHVRGRWGEMQLRRVVESAGMLNRVDFVEQTQTRTDDGVLRPDLIVRLAGGRNVVVDAKVPFLGFLEAAQAQDASAQQTGAASHVRQVRTHIDSLAAKQYWEQFSPTPEFVVMFVPVESFLSAALEMDPAIIEYAFDRQVIIATPTTLMSLLRTVAYAWRQETLAANTQEVLTLGRELHSRLGTMSGHLSKLGRSLEQTAAAYNQTVGSLQTRVLVSARRFQTLGVVDADIPVPDPVNPQLSSLTAVELVLRDDDSQALD